MSEFELIVGDVTESRILYPPRDDRMFRIMERLGVEPALRDVPGTRYGLCDGAGGHVFYLVADVADAFLDIAEMVLDAAPTNTEGEG